MDRFKDYRCEQCGDVPQILYNIIDKEGKTQGLCWHCVKKNFIKISDCDSMKGIKSIIGENPWHK